MGSEKEKQEQSYNMIQILDWAYDKSLNGLPCAGSAIELAKEYEKEVGTIEDKVNSLIRWQISKTATSGFLTGLGGLITLPVAIPTDIASAMYIQIRMIVAIAYLGGYDVKDDKVKSLVYLCLVGESAKDLLKDIGIQIGVKVGKNLIKSMPTKILTKINQTVGFRLVTKFGTKGVVNLVKFVPVLGGVVGGSINGIATHSIGNLARDTFIKTNKELPVAEQFIDFISTNEDEPNLELIKFYSYLNLIKVDGIQKSEEYHLFDNLINNSLLDDDIKMKLIQRLNTVEIEKIDYSIFKENYEESIQLLRNLIIIAKCDKEIHVTEKMYIKNVAKQLNFSEIEIENLIEENY